MSGGLGRKIEEFFDSVGDIFRTEADDDAIMARVAEEKRQRLEAMARDPIRAPYVARIKAGEHWPDEDVQFDANRELRVTCPHLQPIERAMRDAGLDFRPLWGVRVRVNCQVHQAELERRFVLPESVAYREVHIPDRSMLDPRSAAIWCAPCESSIDVLHADVAQATTPWFPV